MIRQYDQTTLTKATGCAHLYPSDLWSKRESYSAWISRCCCFEWKRRLWVLVYKSTHKKTQEVAEKSLFSNSLYSDSKMPSFQAGSLKQGSMSRCYLGWFLKTQVQISEGSDLWSWVLCIADVAYLSLLWPCWQPNLEGALIFPSPPSVSIVSLLHLKL